MTNIALAEARDGSRAQIEDEVVLQVLEGLGVEVKQYQPANGVYKHPTIRSVGSTALPSTVVQRGPSWPGDNSAPDFRQVEH